MTSEEEVQGGVLCYLSLNTLYTLLISRSFENMYFNQIVLVKCLFV